MDAITKTFRTRTRTPILKIFAREERKEKRKERLEKELEVWWWCYYSPSTSDGHNFHTGTPIDAPFVATRSSRYPLRFYPTIEAVLAQARIMSYHPCVRMKVCYELWEAKEGLVEAIASLRMLGE
ncbi:hypothetical protein PIB30_075535 [Stylosanthes scabra]|uniref:Uncharacterized protein n=1 Tax=Stylosanthes scabra TaxID=79078 RepID=A0ABU6USI0_9FABA|nr:hypothetical protein [Stylosanthes scabra]